LGAKLNPSQTVLLHHERILIINRHQAR
jgi:hypothetical protein